MQVFDLCTGLQVDAFRAAADTVNGVDFSPCINLLVSASGHRRYALLPADGWDDAAAAGGVVGGQAAAAVSKDAASVLGGTLNHSEAGTTATSKDTGNLAGHADTRQRLQAEDIQQQVQEQQRADPSDIVVHQHHIVVPATSDVAVLSAASYKPGGMCNSLRLWRLQAQWVTAEAAEELEPAGGGQQLKGRQR